METETYPNRSVPKIFTKYIHSIDKIVPILKIVVVVCQLYVMLLTKYFLLWKKVWSSGQYDRYTENSQYNQASPRPPSPFLLKQQVRKTGWHT